MGPHFARRLLNMREYLHEHHPMARQLMPIDEVPGVRLNFDSHLRMEAHSTHTGKMELAFVDTGVPRPDEHCGHFEEKMMKAKKAAKESKEWLHASPCGQFFQADLSLWIQDQKHKEARKFTATK